MTPNPIKWLRSVAVQFVSALVFLVLPIVAQAVPPAELKPATVAAFENYAKQVQARIDTELSAGPFLWVDGFTEKDRQSAYARLKKGEVVMGHLEQPRCPDGIIHHWVGVVFVPGVTLDRTLRLLQDYDRHSTYYAPGVIQSKLLARNGDEFRIFLRFLRKKVTITVVLNTEHQVNYFSAGPGRAWSRSLSTRIAQVEDASKPDGPEKPVGNDGGFLWRMNNYWRFDERDGGVYIQCESVSLSRDIPILVKWFVEPIVDSTTRESLAFTLTATRSALSKPH